MPELHIKSRTKFTCPLCMSGDAVISRDTNNVPYTICFACRDRDGSGLSRGDWARAVAAEVDAPNAGELIHDPERWLAPYINGVSHQGPPVKLPTMEKVIGWHQALLSNRGALRYLTRERRITERTIRVHKIGYGQSPGGYSEWPAFILPVFAAPGELINIRKRFWPELPNEAKYVGLAGRGSQLYPGRVLARDRLRWLDAVLVAGEFDALVGRQQSLPAVSTTCGAQLPKPLAEKLVRRGGRMIAVLFDVGEAKAAERAVEVLRDAGARAWAVDLPLTEKGADLSDWFSAGGTRGELLDLIVEAKRTPPVA